jgi:hypothetical protein
MNLFFNLLKIYQFNNEDFKIGGRAAMVVKDIKVVKFSSMLKSRPIIANFLYLLLQQEADANVSEANPHIANIGRMVEVMCAVKRMLYSKILKFNLIF